MIFVSYEKYKWALLILVIAGLSDGIDGLIARKFNQGSSLGAYLDPIADKLLLSSSFIVLAFKKQFACFEPRLAHSYRGGGDHFGLGIPPLSAEHLRQVNHFFADRAGLCLCAGRGLSCASSLVADPFSHLHGVSVVHFHRRALLVQRRAPAQCSRAA